jgi:hypothetical protein
MIAKKNKLYVHHNYRPNLYVKQEKPVGGAKDGRFFSQHFTLVVTPCAFLEYEKVYVAVESIVFLKKITCFAGPK